MACSAGRSSLPKRDHSSPIVTGEHRPESLHPVTTLPWFAAEVRAGNEGHGVSGDGIAVLVKRARHHVDSLHAGAARKLIVPVIEMVFDAVRVLPGKLARLPKLLGRSDSGQRCHRSAKCLG